MSAKKVILTQYTFGQGGIDRVCAYLATGIAAQGFETEIIVFCRGGPAESELTALLSKDVKITYLSRLGTPHKSRSRTWDLIRNFPAFVRRLRAAQPDALISSANCMAWVTALGRFVARLHACKLALKITNPVVRPKDRGLLRLIRWHGYNRTFAAADSVWTLSRAEAQTLAHHFPDRTQRFRTVINPYVTAAMKADMRPLTLSSVKQVIAIGRLAPQKRLSALVRAFALIAPDQAHLTLVGDGEERAALGTLIAALGIGDRVTLTGFVDDVLPYLTKADLLVLPSVYEGLPAAVLEAMAVNCPVLATDCFPAAREILEDAEGCGIIENLHPAKLATQIQAHLAQPRPGILSTLASLYSVDNGIANHVGALADMLQVQMPAKLFAPESMTPEIARDVA